MSLHDTIKADAQLVFCNENDFAEPVTYHKRSGLSRSIMAVVIREQLATLPEANDIVLPVFEVHVANNADTGVTSEELDCGGDMIEFAIRVGEPVTRRSIVRLLSHDEGMVVLECR
jgi:hypothetical protein